MTIEDATHDFLKDAIEAAAGGDALHGTRIDDTVYEDITGVDYGIRIGDCDADCAPTDEDVMEEFDAKLTVVFYARITDNDVASRKAARTLARQLWLQTARLFWADTTMGGRVRDVLVRRARRGYDTENGTVYAIVNMPLLVNGTGQLLSGEENL